MKQLQMGPVHLAARLAHLQRGMWLGLAMQKYRPTVLTRYMTLQVAQKFFHYGMLLQQVANFYNSISGHMLECHKPCLIEYASAFEAICLHPTDSQVRGCSICIAASH